MLSYQTSDRFASCSNGRYLPLSRETIPRPPVGFVGGDAYIAPANRTDFSGIFGEFDTSQWVDVGIDPYGENGRLIKIYKPAIWMMPLHKSATMQQAVMTPAPIESMAWESRLPKSAATSAPVHAPVPGRGMATKR